MFFVVFVVVEIFFGRFVFHFVECALQYGETVIRCGIAVIFLRLNQAVDKVPGLILVFAFSGDAYYELRRYTVTFGAFNRNIGQHGLFSVGSLHFIVKGSEIVQILEIKQCLVISEILLVSIGVVVIIVGCFCEISGGIIEQFDEFVRVKTAFSGFGIDKGIRAVVEHA